MNSDNYIVFMNYLFNVENIPFCLFQGEELLLQLPSIEGFIEKVKPYITSLKKRNRQVTYISTSYDAFYGLILIKEHDLWIFTGPYFTTPIKKEVLPFVLEAMEIPEQETDRIKIFLNELPYGPLHHFLSYLSCLNYSLNHELLTIEDIDYNPDFHDQSTRIQTKFASISYESRENEEFHDTYLEEMHRLDLIASGNVTEMKKNMFNPLPGRYGIIGGDALRQAKNIFIAGCTMYTRAAIAGGLDIEEAYRLSDIYIQTSESYTSIADVERLHRRMPLDFTERVAREIQFKNVSQPIISAIHYIKEHINQPLQAEQIASHVNLSTSYFLKRFKTETGFGVSEFITNAKIEEACLLLSYTDKSLTEISNYLYFSSQSYFQNVFKKITGITPGQYRNMKKRPVFMKNI